MARVEGVPKSSEEQGLSNGQARLPVRPKMMKRSRGRGMSLVSLAVFDVGGPLVVYYGLRSSGASTVVALVVSGLPPAAGIALGAWQHRRVDAIGVVVLFGIAVGTVVGLASGSARLVLLDGTVPTAVLGLVCFGSLPTSRPLMFRTALQFIGPDSTQGRQFQSMWQYREFRRIFTVITLAWGAAFLIETAAQVTIVESASASTAKTTSNLMPIAVAALMITWTAIYGRRRRARGGPEATTGHAGAGNSIGPEASVLPAES